MNQKGLAAPIIILLVLIVTGLVGLRTYQQLKDQPEQKTTVKTGKVITAARVFSLEDKTVYLALDLDSAKSGTNIDYIRYLNGRYVDHGNSKLTKDFITNISFSWTNTRSLGSIIEGKWKIATYTNGILEKSVNYVVQKDQVSQVQVEEPTLAESVSLKTNDY